MKPRFELKRGSGKRTFSRGENSEPSSVRDRGSLKRSAASSEVLGTSIVKNFRGVIIEESLEDISLLQCVEVISTKVSEVNEKHKTPWLEKWTLHTVEIERDSVEKIATKISESIDQEHSHSWYADFNDGEWHYVVFPNKVFKINMGSENQYAEAKQYGISLGIPAYQVDFHPKDRKAI